MGVSEELMADFGIKMPRILVCGKTAVVDNVKRIELIEPDNIVVYCGSRYISINGSELVVEQLDEQRMQVVGNISTIELYGDKSHE